MEIWDLQLAKLGTIVSLLRQDYTDKVAKFSHHIYQGISSQKENLRVEYQSTVFDKLGDREYTQDKSTALSGTAGAEPGTRYQTGIYRHWRASG